MFQLLTVIHQREFKSILILLAMLFMCFGCGNKDAVSQLPSGLQAGEQAGEKDKKDDKKVKVADVCKGLSDKMGSLFKELQTMMEKVSKNLSSFPNSVEGIPFKPFDCKQLSNIPVIQAPSEESESENDNPALPVGPIKAGDLFKVMEQWKGKVADFSIKTKVLSNMDPGTNADFPSSIEETQSGIANLNHSMSDVFKNLSLQVRFPRR